MRILAAALFGVVISFFVQAAASAAGFIIIGPPDEVVIVRPPHHWRPPPPPPPPVAPAEQAIRLRSQQIVVGIQSQVATTTMEQVFYNPNNRQLEGTFIYPLEDDVAVKAFHMWMDGKETTGELLDSDKARGIYENIVRQMKDPGLLEYAGRRMIRCRVFPIPANGECKIKLSYTQGLKADGGLVEYTYPMKAESAAAGDQDQVTISVDIAEKRDILNLYSPTHSVDVVRKDPRHLVASFEGRNVRPDRDFKLFYNLSNKDVGLSFLPFRAEGEDGYFMAILTPRDTSDAADVIGKDVVFVLDTSGSMADDGKIDQARGALKFCLASLNEKDRFGLVTFATEANAYKPELEAAGKDAVRKAIEHVEKNVRATGGTAIDEALAAALKMNTAKDRPFMVVFLTDGEPTLGERDPAAILKNVKGRTLENVRVFSFGVGYNVNRELLDELSAANRGQSTYVVPKENIEVKVGSFYARVSSPVLTDVTVDFKGADVYDVYPKTIGDIFRDQQVVLVGRYRGHGAQAIRLSGRLGSKERETVYEAAFPEKAGDHDFVPRMWALRKVGFMLEDLRKRGETPEVKSEIVRLSKQYGIMTPYTSWLVIEDGRRDRVGGPIPPPMSMPAERALSAAAAASGRELGGRFSQAPASPQRKAEADVMMLESAKMLSDAPSGGLQFGSRDGFKKDVERRNEALGGGSGPAPAAASRAAEETVLRGQSLSRARDELVKEEKLQADGTYRLQDAKGEALVREAGGRTFYRVDGRWIDSTYQAGKETVKVKYLSDDYFKLLREKPELAKAFALGSSVVAASGGKFYEVVE